MLNRFGLLFFVFLNVLFFGSEWNEVEAVLSSYSNADFEEEEFNCNAWMIDDDISHSSKGMVAESILY
jgi:hypothetical protein